MTKPEIIEPCRFLDERVGAENDGDLARGGFFPEFRFRCFRREIIFVEDGGAASRGKADDRLVRERDIFEEFLECFEMLAGEDLGRRHEDGLKSVFGRRDRGDRGDDRFARTDVALEQAVHGMRFRHVLHDLPERLFLRLGKLEGERRENVLDAFNVDRDHGAPARSRA